MKLSQILLSLLILFSLGNNRVRAFKVGDIVDFFEGKIKKYPETKNKKISFHIGQSPLAPIENLQDKSKREFEKAKQSQERLVSLAAANKIIGFADGFINVKYQVQDGVKNALKDTFLGYPEYQRRKSTEEIVNSNLKAHLKSLDFINTVIDIKQPNNPIEIIKGINSSKQIKNIKQAIKKLANLLFISLLGFSILARLFSNVNLEVNYFSELIKKIFIYYILFFNLERIWKLLLSSFLYISQIIYTNTSSFLDFNLVNSFSYELKLINAWEMLLRKFGYFPALVISLIDSLSQIFLNIMISLSISLISVIMIISPIILCYSFYGNRNFEAISNSFTFTAKCLLVFSLSPILISIIQNSYIYLESSELEYNFIFLSISSLISISLSFLMLCNRKW